MWCRSRLELPLPASATGRCWSVARRASHRPRSVEHCGLARGAAPPSNPQLPAPLDPTTEPVVGALVAKRHHPPPHSRRDADAPCRWVGGHGVGRRRRRIPSCRVEAEAVRQSVDFRRERGPVGGRGGAEHPSPAPAGDPRSVAPKGKLAHDLLTGHEPAPQRIGPASGSRRSPAR